MWPESTRYRQTFNVRQELGTRIEVWTDRANRVMATDDAPFISGSVTDTWVTGIRRTLSLSMPDIPIWQELLDLPACEIRPFVGVGYGRGLVDWFPVGRFSPKRRPRSAVPATLSITGDDRWRQVMSDEFPDKTSSNTGIEIRQTIANLITETGYQRAVRNYATSTAMTPVVVWDSRQTAIVDLCRSIGAEAFIDREGIPILQDRLTVPTDLSITTGRDGTAVNIVEDIDYGNVWNTVTVRSTNNDFKAAPVTLTVTDTALAAHPSHIGMIRKVISSSLYTTTDQMITSAKSWLAKGLGPSRQITITCVPDYSVDAGDQFTIYWDATRGLASESCIVGKITTPLPSPGSIDDAQTITTYLDVTDANSS